MTHSFIDFINSKVKINEEIKSSTLAMCKVETLKKGHLLLEEEKMVNRLFFILSGAARTYYLHDGKDITSWIYRQGQLASSWGSLYAREPSQENLELVEDSAICSISYEDIQILYAKYTEMQTFGRIIAEEQIVFIDFFYKGFMFMNAKEKYDLLLSFFPDVTQRVNLGHIASFLGITQETLSRIRRK